MIEIQLVRKNRPSGTQLADRDAVALFNGGHAIMEYREADEGHMWGPWKRVSVGEPPLMTNATLKKPMTGTAQQHQGATRIIGTSAAMLASYGEVAEADRCWISKGTENCDHDWELCEGSHCCTYEGCDAEFTVLNRSLPADYAKTLDDMEPGKVAWVPNSMAFGLMQLVDDGDGGVVLTMSGKALAMHFTKDDMDKWLCNLYMAKIDDGMGKVMAGEPDNHADGPDT